MGTPCSWNALSERLFHLQLYLPLGVVASASQQPTSRSGRQCRSSRQTLSAGLLRCFAHSTAYVRECPHETAHTAARTKSECKNDVQALNLKTCSRAAAVKCLPAVRSCRCRPC